MVIIMVSELRKVLRSFIIKIMRYFKIISAFCILIYYIIVAESPRVSAAAGPRGKRVQTPVQVVRSPTVPLPAPLPAPVPVLPPPKEQVTALAHAAKGVEALGVLVQYLVFRVRFI